MWETECDVVPRELVLELIEAVRVSHAGRVLELLKRIVPEYTCPEGKEEEEIKVEGRMQDVETSGQ